MFVVNLVCVTVAFFGEHEPAEVLNKHSEVNTSDVFLFVPINHLEIRVAGNPTTRRRLGVSVALSPSRTAVLRWGQTSQILSG